jgi:hypothetical protein
MSPAELREPRCQHEVDFRIQVLELHLHSSETGTDIGGYLFPEIADAKSATSQDPDEQTEKGRSSRSWQPSPGNAAFILTRF